MVKMKKEIVLISMCSLGIPCQYRPRSFRKKIIEKYKEKYTLIPVCPEQLGGLQTPRSACRLENGRVIGKDGKDYTKEYKTGSEWALKIVKMYGIKKAYMKKGSPSCGKNGITRKLLEKNGIKVYQV